MNPISDDPADLFFDIDGTEHCDEEACLSLLLRDEILFSNEREFTFMGEAQSTVVLYVNCSDLFAWGCADGEPLPHAEIGRLTRMHLADRARGASKWCCLRRDEQPQGPVKRRWQDAGAWDEAMDRLPPNVSEARIAEMMTGRKAGSN